MSGEDTETITEELTVNVDPDGPGPLPPIRVEVPIPKDKRFYAGIVVGWLAATAVYLGVGVL